MNKRTLKRYQSLKPNINIVNFKKSSNSYRRFNEHIKYILNIRENEMNFLANQFKKALEENEKEKDLHYKVNISFDNKNRVQLKKSSHSAI